MSNSECRDTPIAVSKTKQTPVVAATSCTNAAGAKKVSIKCPVGSATFCNASSDSSALYVVILPLSTNPNDGITSLYMDPVTGATLSNCYDLWNNFLGTNTPLYGITGVMAIIPGQGGSNGVSCNDVSGCTFASTTCLTTWDNDNQAPSTAGISASIPTSGRYLTCAFIDSVSAGGGLGVPPVPNNPSNSGYASFGGINVSLGNGVGEVDAITKTTITFSNWSDYGPQAVQSHIRR